VDNTGYTPHSACEDYPLPWESSPSYSPDGNWIVYVFDFKGPGPSIVTTRVPFGLGGGLTGVKTSTSASDPRVDSPDWGVVPQRPPQTTIDSGPSGTITRRRATFSFSSSEPDSGFRCKLDQFEWYDNCSSPERYRWLLPGKHVVKVQAIDADGLADPTPVVRRFRVDPS
jgi:hypothetical protein